jgi:hypothetical protein
MLEGQLPPNPSGGTALPVQYSLTIGDAAGGTQVSPDASTSSYGPSGSAGAVARR